MNLVRELANKPDLHIDLLLIRASGPHLTDIPSNVSVYKLTAKHTLTAIPEIRRYLIDHKPEAMLVAKDRAGRAAVRARALAGVDTRIVLRLGTNLSTALAHRSGLQRWLRTAPMKRIYQKIDHVVAVSEGVRQDTLAIAKMPAERISVVRNPVVTDQMLANAQQKADHPWLADASLNVVMGIGRLSTQKDFHCLISAFASVAKQRDALRLILLGDGKQRDELKQLSEDLGVSSKIDFVGFQHNPYGWLSQADVFVLSSRWEGSPNVLTEALALGIPSVSTRCPSGPNEVLEEGKYGPLVPVGDDTALAAGIAEVLDKPHDASFIQQAVADYNPKTSAERYLSILQGDA